MTPRHDVVIIGAGLAGLAAARRIARAGLSPLVLEAAAAVGGRVATEERDGFLLDRGFQVFLDSYPEARAVLDLPALQLARFEAGALVRHAAGVGRVADPWRSPVAGARSLVSGVFTPADAWRMLRLRADALRASRRNAVAGLDDTTANALRVRGFSDRAVDGFFRPFFGGVFLDAELDAPTSWFEFLFGMFATGYATLPRDGMRAIPQQLAAALPAGAVRTSARVRSVSEGRVELASGEQLTARAVVLATDAQQASALVTGRRAPSWSGCATLYFAAAASPLDSPLLMLNGVRGSGPVNHLCVPSDVQPSYAPTGQALISATIVNPSGADDAALDRAARAQLGEWFGADVLRSWRTLGVVRVPQSLPRSIPRPETRDAAVRLAPRLVACGDYLETPSINGALRSGRRAADAVLKELGVSSESAA